MSKIALGMAFFPLLFSTATWLKQTNIAKLAPQPNQMYNVGPGNNGIQLVPLNDDDISAVAALIVKGFDGEFPWWKGLQKTYSLWNTEAQMEHRYNKFIMRRSRPFHLMTVAKDRGVAVGYIELGLVPINENPSSSSHRHYDDEDDKLDGIYVDSGLGYPTIGNLVVDSKYRRQGVAMALMNHTINEARRWGFDDIFCAVELDNTAAFTMYKDKLEFEEFRYERAGESPGLKKDRCLLRKRIGNGLGVKFEGGNGLGGNS